MCCGDDSGLAHIGRCRKQHLLNLDNSRQQSRYVLHLDVFRVEVVEALGNFRQGNVGDLEVSPLHLFKLIRKTHSGLKVTFLIPRRCPVYPMVLGAEPLQK